MLTSSHPAGPGHSGEHHRVAYSVEAIIGVGLVLAGIACVVAIVGFFTGSWMLGSAGIPALMILLLLYGLWTMGRGKHEDPDQELHDVE